MRKQHEAKSKQGFGAGGDPKANLSAAERAKQALRAAAEGRVARENRERMEAIEEEKSEKRSLAKRIQALYDSCVC